MKHLCCSRILFLFIFTFSALFAGLTDKSAIVYYGEKISYPMVGIHDYIIVQPSQINTYTHGFSVYKEKMYAYVSIGEIDRDIEEFKSVKKEWIVAENEAWSSDVLDLTNPAYREFLFEKMIEPQMNRGFKNFFFDTLDSYQLHAKTPEARKRSEMALVNIIKEFHSRYPDAKLIINRGFEIIDQVHEDIEAVLFESYYAGLGGDELGYKYNSDADREWLDNYIHTIQKYKLPIIAVDYLENPHSQEAYKLVTQLQAKNLIPYIATKALTHYGLSSKEPIKREILTLIDESNTDRITLAPHLYGALPLEYKGYIQSLLDVNKETLPTMQNMQQYAGVIIWLRNAYSDPNKLFKWILNLQKLHIKVVFAGDFFIQDNELLKKLGIKIQPKNLNTKYTVSYKDKMIGYEAEPSLSDISQYYTLTQGKALFSVVDNQGAVSTLAAITPWGGYAIDSAFIIELLGDNLWTINPFTFFTQALRLKTIPVPDTTTKNGKRILFSHIDGDGSMNRAEWNTELFSEEVIYKEILSKYPIPHSVSIVGGEIDSEGLYPKLAPKLQEVVRAIYRLPNVEGATHTFSHPFYWGEIKDGDLNPKYRLKIPNYNFSLLTELKGSLDTINYLYLPKGKKKAKTIFWSGDCAPTEPILANTYENGFLNINGGDTYISNTHPWLSYVAPIGLDRGGYYQIYTGAQNENVYTNEWHGPFWGFKKVLQTFNLTNSPKRLKPIDIYYHFYSGSKRASLNALKYVFDWALKQDTFALYTSEYIPIAMDYYTLSMAQEKNSYLVSGTQNLKTLRLERTKKSCNIKESKNILGTDSFEQHQYIHLGEKKSALVTLSEFNHNQNIPYLISTNAEVKTDGFKDKRLSFKLKSSVALELELYLPKNCNLTTKPQLKIEKSNRIYKVFSKDKRQGVVNVLCH